MYELELLKPAHYSLNITDYHFDTGIDLFAQSASELGLNPEVVKDFISIINRIRRDITTGFTVRMEVARKSAEKAKDGLLKKLGGEAGIAAFNNRLFEIVAMDSRLRKPLHNRNIELFKTGFKTYFTELVGGPKK